MSLTAICSLEWARRKLFINSNQNMCKNLKLNVFGLKEAEMSLTAISSLESARRKFFMSSTHIIARK